MSATPHTILYRSFWNFAHVFAMVWRCACGLDVILELIFVNFFHFVNFVIFWPQILWKCIDSGYHVSATPYTTSCLSVFNFAHLFVHGLKMCMWFGFNPAVNFCPFSTLLTLSFFSGATPTSPKFDLYLYNDTHRFVVLCTLIWATSREKLSLVIWDQVCLKTACSATATSYC